MGARNKEEVLEELLDEVKNRLEELCQSGFCTVHDSTWKGIEDMAGIAKQYGMAYLSEMLGELAEGIHMRRHRLEQERDALAGLYARLNEYLYLCGEKLAYDRGRDYYAGKRM